MANFANTAAGRVLAENLVKTRMAANTWLEGHMGVDKSGNTVCRFLRPLSASLATTEYTWVESRADDAT